MTTTRLATSTLFAIGTLVLAAGAPSPAAASVLIDLNDPSFENGGSGTPSNTNYRNWGAGNENIGTYNAGAGAGNNEGKWGIRGFSGALNEGDLRQDGVPGKTGNQYIAYALTSSPEERGLFQYVELDAGQKKRSYVLDVDVYSPTTATNEYLLTIFGFDDPTEVSIDIGGAAIVSHAGPGGFEQFSTGWLTTDATGAFVEKRLGITFASGPYDYVGVLMAAQFIGGGASDLVGFDNVRLNAVPEPSSGALALLTMAGAAVWRRRK